MMRSARLIMLRLLYTGSIYRRVAVYATLVVLFYFLLRYFSVKDPDWDFDEVQLEEHVAQKSALQSPNWIVCTTIFHPTHALRVISKQLASSWKLVVVGDRKTPESWRLPGVIYLSVKAQKELGYRVHQYLPYDSYSRKTIGYLYAIQHGAKYIYDIDDDTLLEGELADLHLTSDPERYLVVSTKNQTYNPYVHFGQSTLWPRGYPLNKIGFSGVHDYKLCWTRAPAVRQGLVNGDPDVDAIFRLTRRSATSPLNITFDRTAPIVVLPPGVFAPFNSQNTLFASTAFWALVLPTMVTNRATDIYRSYWAQKLLSLIGENIAFVPPNARQRRMGHVDIDDARDETELYVHIDRYVQVLDAWRCKEKMFFDCIGHLSHHLVREGLWKSRDAQVVDAWIADLAALGYPSPMLSPEVTGPCLSTESKKVIFYADEQLTTMPNTEALQHTYGVSNQKLIVDELDARCGLEQSKSWQSTLPTSRKYDNILLVISVHSDLQNVVPFLEATYKPHFRSMLYCVNQELDREFIHRWRISVVKLSEDIGTVSCLSAAVQMQYHTSGMLHITETMRLHPESAMMKKIASLAWMTGDFVVYKSDMMTKCAAHTIHCKMMPKDLLVKVTNEIIRSKLFTNPTKKSLQACMTKLEKDPNWLTQAEVVWITDLAVYLPSRLYAYLEHYRTIFLTDTELMQFELMTILFIECDQLTVEYLRFTEEPQAAESADYIYPFFFKSIRHVDETRKRFCESISVPQ